MADWEEQLRLGACAAARAAGAIVREAFGKGSRYEHKSAAIDLVTETDRAAEACVERFVAESFPGHGVLGEEGASRAAEAGKPVWIVDPLDGTTNFAHGMPILAVSVGVQQEDRMVAGAIYDPIRDELFSAGRGQGAWLGDERLNVSTTEQLGSSLVVTGFPYDRRERADYYLAFVAAVLKRAQGVRRCGAAAVDLAWVAAGRFDAYWELGLKPWDLAAGVVIVEEAGGRISDDQGNRLDPNVGRIVASNGRVHDELLAALATAAEPTQERLSTEPHRG